MLSRQAKRRHLKVSTLSSLYLKEKALEEEFPGIGFRDSVGGPRCVQGSQVDYQDGGSFWLSGFPGEVRPGVCQGVPGRDRSAAKGGG